MAGFLGWQYYSVDYGVHLNESKFTAGFGQQAWYAANPSFGINEDVIDAQIGNASKFIIIGEAARSDGTPSRGGLFPLNDTTDPTKYYDGFSGGPAAGTLTSQARPFKRHFDGSIFCYADGHAKWTQIGKTWATPVATPATSTTSGAATFNSPFSQFGDEYPMNLLTDHLIQDVEQLPNPGLNGHANGSGSANGNGYTNGNGHARQGFQLSSVMVGFERRESRSMTIRFEDITKTFAGRAGAVMALDDINVTIEEGEFVCLVGPSGCGKSTLLNMLAGFDHPSHGQVTMDGVPVNAPSIERVMMFQESALFPWMSARANVEFGLKSLRMPTQERRKTAEKYLRMVHLGQFADAQPHELSGGMRQRVALARSLAVNPKVLLMDEPFAALDAQTRDHLHIELQNIWRETRKTIVFVTHNVREAVTLATRVLVFTARPGRIKQEFNLEDLSYPRRTTEPLVAETVSRVQAALRDEVAAAEASEYDPH